METVYLALGSNIGERESFLQKALTLLHNLPNSRVQQCSKLYRTKPLGNVTEHSFVNMCARYTTELQPLELLKQIKEIEKLVGRATRERWAAREIDIDIVLYGSEVINSKELVIPHPGMLERDFVLQPLLDLTPQLQNPVSGIFFRDTLYSLDQLFIEESLLLQFRILEKEIISVYE